MLKFQQCRHSILYYVYVKLYLERVLVYFEGNFKCGNFRTKFVIVFILRLFQDSNTWEARVSKKGGSDRRMGHTATYDPEKNVVYVFGGSKNKRWFSDVHVLDLNTWQWEDIKVCAHCCLYFLIKEVNSLLSVNKQYLPVTKSILDK